jgi:hypothetical protein
MVPYEGVTKMSTIQIKRDEVKAENGQKFLGRLNKIYEGKWVAILASGEIVANENLNDVYAEAKKKASRILALFRASKKGQMMYR